MAKTLRITEIAKHFGINQSTINRMAKTGEIPSNYFVQRKKGSPIYFDPAVINFLATMINCKGSYNIKQHALFDASAKSTGKDTITELIEEIVEQRVQEMISARQEDIESKIMEVLKKMLQS